MSHVSWGTRGESSLIKSILKSGGLHSQAGCHTFTSRRTVLFSACIVIFTASTGMGTLEAAVIRLCKCVGQYASFMKHANAVGMLMKVMQQADKLGRCLLLETHIPLSGYVEGPLCNLQWVTERSQWTPLGVKSPTDKTPEAKIESSISICSGLKACHYYRQSCIFLWRKPHQKCIFMCLAGNVWWNVPLISRFWLPTDTDLQEM